MDEPGGELCTGSLWSLFIPPAMSLPLLPVDSTPPSGQSLLAPSPLDSLAPAQEELPSPSLLSPCHSHTYPHRAPHASWGDGKGDDRVTGGGSIGQTPDKRHLRPTSFQTPAASNSAVVGESDLSGMEAAATPRGQQGQKHGAVSHTGAWRVKVHREGRRLWFWPSTPRWRGTPAETDTSRKLALKARDQSEGPWAVTGTWCPKGGAAKSHPGPCPHLREQMRPAPVESPSEGHRSNRIPVPKSQKSATAEGRARRAQVVSRCPLGRGPGAPRGQKDTSQ